MTRTKQANSLNCFVCGIQNPLGLHLKFYETAPGEVEAECTVTEQYQGYPGIVHGGIVSAMLDELAGRSMMGDTSAPRFMFTARLQVRYHKNVPIGQPLRLIGKAGESRGRKSTATSAIYDCDGTLLAEAEVLMINVPQSVVEDVDLQALGWKVYPDESPEFVNEGHI
jgi:uncharacterized protein (TIGR00369 family)